MDEKKKLLPAPIKKRYLDMVEIPSTGTDVLCDKCKRIIPQGLSYYKFIWQDNIGDWKSHRSHKICFDLNPEKELN